MLKVTHVPNDKIILYFVFGELVKKFQGESIPGFCKVIQNSNDFHIVPGVRTLTLHLPERGSWGSKFAKWSDIVEFFECDYSLDAIQAIVRAEFPATAKRLDKIASDLDDLPCHHVDKSSSSRKRPRHTVKGIAKTLHAR